MTVQYVQGVDLPDLTVTWKDSDGQLVDFSAAYTFALKVGQPGGSPAFTKTAGITGSATAPNVNVAWANGELDSLPVDDYTGQLTATRITDNKTRAIQFELAVRPAAIGAGALGTTANIAVNGHAPGPLSGGTTGYYDITGYGATTASADNKTAIDAAIAAAAVSGGVVYFPPGTWSTTGSHEIPLNVSVRGAGKGVTFINHTGVGTYCFFVGSTTAGPSAPSYMGVIRDFSLNGQSAGDGTGSFGHQIGIWVLNCLLFNLQDIHASLLYTAFLIDGGDEVALGAGTFAGNGYVANCTASNVFIGFHIYRWVTDSLYSFCYCYGNSPKVPGSVGFWFDAKPSTSTLLNASTEGIDTGILVTTVNQGLCFINPRLEDCNTYVNFATSAWGHVIVGGNLQENPTAPTWPAGSAGGANTILARDGYFQQAPAGGLPAAGSSYRHAIYRVDGGAGVADGIYICTKNAAGAYAWHEITVPTAAAAPTGVPGPLDQGLKGWTYDPVAAGAAGTALTSGQVKYWKVVVAAAATIAGVALYNINAAAGPTGTFVGLYDSAGTRQAVSADVSAATTSGGTLQLAFTAPYAAAAGTYYVGIVQTATTPMAPARAGIGSSIHYNLGTAAAPFRFNSGASGQTTLPATVVLGSLAASSDAYWAALY